MDRKPIIAGNWKMHYTVREATTFAAQLIASLAQYESVERVVCPPFVALAAVADTLRGSPIRVGAQDVHFAEKGAYTSEISAGMLRGLAEYVIIGHSEVRAYLGDTDERINKKIKAALLSELKPIFAVGEVLAQYQAGETAQVVGEQVRAGLDGVGAEHLPEMIVAYEPVWAIGTGLNADAAYANDTIGTIRETIRRLYGSDIADAVRIQYGGSVKPGNMAEYMAEPEIDGALVGGASLKADDFTALVAAAAEAKG
jgi:triosephosphate isomerase (TIM)